MLVQVQVLDHPEPEPELVQRPEQGLELVSAQAQVSVSELMPGPDRVSVRVAGRIHLDSAQATPERAPAYPRVGWQRCRRLRLHHRLPQLMLGAN